MNRAEKAELVSQFGARASGSAFVVLTEFRGTKVSDINQFRRDLEKNGMGFRVLKNTLARRAFTDIGFAGLERHLKGMTGVVLSGPDGIASAKVLRDLLKPLQTVQVRAGYFDGGLLEADAVKIVADLPGREELLSMLLATIQEGPRQLVSVIAAPARDLVQILKNYEDKLALAEADQAAAS
ncbi:MAG: 50S ribosomal protein L10 [Pseudomonadota bacterium]|nr:50S ribosomal protein L10 [Pseudomonadota bacterium]